MLNFDVVLKVVDVLEVDTLIEDFEVFHVAQVAEVALQFAEAVEVIEVIDVFELLLILLKTSWAELQMLIRVHQDRFYSFEMLIWANDIL